MRSNNLLFLERTSKLMATIAESDPTINVSNSNTPSTIKYELYCFYS